MKGLLKQQKRKRNQSKFSQNKLIKNLNQSVRNHQRRSKKSRDKNHIKA